MESVRHSHAYSCYCPGIYKKTFTCSLIIAIALAALALTFHFHLIAEPARTLGEGIAYASSISSLFGCVALYTGYSLWAMRKCPGFTPPPEKAPLPILRRSIRAIVKPSNSLKGFDGTILARAP